jgi:transcriptional regulator with XRE-family HTH domain
MRKKRLASPFPTATPFRLPASLSAARQEPKPPARSEPVARVGAQIRALRMAAGASGAELAQNAGVSRSLLSRIERGLVSPSVETLDRIANGLNVSISRFFVDHLARTDFSYVPAGKGILVDRIGAVAGYRYELLGHLLSGNLFIEPYLVRLLPDAKPYKAFQHPGLKFVYLLSGQVRYRYGVRDMALDVGDSLLFDATALHGIESIDEGPVSYLSVVFTMRD